jgi:hypothetical protein
MLAIGFSACSLRVLPDAIQLTAPVPFERARPLVERLDRIGVRPVQDSPPVASYVHEPDAAKHLEVLGHGGLPQPERFDHVSDGVLRRREVFEYLPPPGLGNGVERIGRRGGARHEGILIPISEYVKPSRRRMRERG